jgi:serine/threonine protein kinase
LTRLPVSLPPGARLGGYEITARIAAGRRASVYAGRRVEPAPPGPGRDGATVALKLFPPAVGRPAERVEAGGTVDRELAFAGGSPHDCLVRSYGSFRVDDPGSPALHGAAVLVMELASCSLRSLLARAASPGGPLPHGDQILARVCRALAHLHGRGWVHGDLKPGNVLMMPDGRARLSDFGRATPVQGVRAVTSSFSVDLAPPEWWAERAPGGSEAHPADDMWAFGLLAHQVVTGGVRPFRGRSSRSRWAAAQSYASGDAPLVLARQVPERWRALIAGCLSPTRAGRLPYTAAAVLAALGPPAAGAPSAPAGTRRP